MCVYLALVFLGGSLLAPWLYHLIQWGAANYSGLEHLAQNPFHRYVNRSLIVLGVLGLVPYLRRIGVRSWTGAGLGRTPAMGKHLGQGFLLGFGSLAIVAVVTVMAGARNLNHQHTGAEVLKHIGNAGLAAILVAPLEELLFRGALFGGLRKACAWPGALLVSSALYALVHFFERPASPETVDWASGLVVLGRMMRGFVDLDTLIPGFFNLTLAGIILGLGYHLSGTLYFSIGLHAGWIFWLKSFGFMTEEAARTHRWFWGTGKLIDGWLAFAILSGVLIVVWRTRHPKSPALPCPPAGYPGG
jgi:membrane protease YdiL (CAAX protease family)